MGVAREMVVVRIGTLSVDGAKVRRMSKEEARLKEEIQGLLSRAGAADSQEDERYGDDMRGDEFPAELGRREKRLATMEEANARPETAQRAGNDAR